MGTGSHGEGQAGEPLRLRPGQIPPADVTRSLPNPAASGKTEARIGERRGRVNGAFTTL